MEPRLKIKLTGPRI